MWLLSFPPLPLFEPTASYLGVTHNAAHVVSPTAFCRRRAAAIPVPPFCCDRAAATPAHFCCCCWPAAGPIVQWPLGWEAGRGQT